MILSMSAQAVFFLHTVLIGVFAGLFYDCFRLLRIYVKHSDFVIHAEDLIYWAVVTIFAFYFLLNRYYGEIRGFCFIGHGLGMVLYFAWPSKFFLRVSRIVIDFLCRILNAVFDYLTYPVKIIIKFLKKPAEKVCIFVKKQLQNCKNYVRIKAIHFKRDLTIILKKV